MSTDATNVHQAKEEQVQVDMSNMIGRIKPKPVCLDLNLRAQSTPTEGIRKFVFSTGDGSPVQTVTKSPLDAGSQELSVVSSGSSTASRENALLDASASGTSNQGIVETKQKVIMPPFADGDFSLRKERSEQINLKVKTQTISRNGRQTQRYYTDKATNIIHRMTTGCIPILKDGRIMFCSASRKAEWIIPKGGWENDEIMEESAIRETFEEGGVFGVIGPKLSEIAYETRKGKKRRIEFEEVQRKVKEIREAQSSGIMAVSPTSNEGTTPSPQTASSPKEPVVSSATEDANGGSADKEGSSGQPEKLAKVNQPQSSDGDNMSVASETSLAQSHIKMSLFPLYVTEVCDEWPEQGRTRKVVDIDEAIRITEPRPYFQAALKELKQRNLHLCQDFQAEETASSTVSAPSATGPENIKGEI